MDDIQYQQKIEHLQGRFSHLAELYRQGQEILQSLKGHLESLSKENAPGLQVEGIKNDELRWLFLGRSYYGRIVMPVSGDVELTAGTIEFGEYVGYPLHPKKSIDYSFNNRGLLLEKENGTQYSLDPRKERKPPFEKGLFLLEMLLRLAGQQIGNA